MAHPQRVPLRRLIEQVGISTEQSVAVVIEVARHLHEWMALARSRDLLVPGIRDLRLERGGTVSWHAGHALPARAVIPAMGALLTALLRHNGARSSVPAGLMYLLVRSTHDPSLAPFIGLEELITALGRFAPLSTEAALDSLVARYTIARAGLPEIDSTSTVSDIRRLRRAGGVSLATISKDTGIPLSLLRELEWGVYVNWPAVHADGSVRAYALRAGLDPELTLNVVAREREESERVPAPVRPALQAVSEAGPLSRRMLPWAAIATLALGALFVGAGDRSPKLQVSPAPAHATVQPAPAATVAEQPATTPAPRATVTRPVPQAVPATPRPERAVKPSRVTNRTSSAVRHPTQQVTRSSHPMMWLARALAGDGKYDVQPFPRAKEP